VLVGVGAFGLVLCAAPLVRGQVPDGVGFAPEGPAPSVPPAVIARDAEGRVTLRAHRLAEGLTVDGRLDEEVYLRVPPASGFIQQLPREAEPATEQTDIWVFFDDQNVYVSARNWDTQPDRMIANEMRRDHRNINRGETLTVVLDTFHDGRNGFLFETNPLGALRDGLFTNESNTNTDWNTVWDVKTSRFDQGWLIEMVIPFKSLRYTQGRDQVWGINFRRVVQWKNEVSYLTPMPASYSFGAISRVSSAATLVGIEAPSGSRNIELKPFAISSVATNLNAEPLISNDLSVDVGFDAKYGITQGLIADFTVNTDFAQVEDDEEQVNLTRFSLFFPEKREFFLEGQGIFAFGGASTGGFRQGLTPIMFFSRRIGLGDEGAVPIRAGARVTGRAGRYTVGLLDIQQGANDVSTTPPTNFSVVRLRRDILRRSTIGVLATNRSVALETPGSNQLVGVDAELAFYQNVRMVTYYAQTRTAGLSDGESSYLGLFEYRGDRYGVNYEHLAVGENFNPEVGFYSRRNFRRNFANLRFSPRTATSTRVRRYRSEVSFDYITNSDGRLETREASADFGIEMHNGDNFGAQYTRQYEFLEEEFEIADDIILQVDGYSFHEASVSYRLGPQRRVTGDLSFNRGSFFNGDRTQLSYDGIIEVTPAISIEPRVSLNWVDLVQGSFTTTLVRTRATVAFSARMFVGALVQYNSSNAALSANIRLRWEYQPGSDLFVVYSEGRDTSLSGFPTVENRGFIVKLTRLLRF